MDRDGECVRYCISTLSEKAISLKIVIVGAGEVGFHIASRLSLENKDVVLIEKNADALRRVAENVDVQTIEGCGSSGDD